MCGLKFTKGPETEVKTAQGAKPTNIKIPLHASLTLTAQRRTQNEIKLKHKTSTAHKLKNFKSQD